MGHPRVFPGLMEPEQESALLGCCTSIPVEEGQRVVSRGEPGNDMFVVESGSLKVVDERSGEDFVLTVLKPGDIFGEMSFIDGMPRSATVVSMERGTLLRMGPEEFGALQDRDQRMATILLKALARLVVRRLRKTDEALLFLASDEEEPGSDEQRELENLIREMSRAVNDELSREDLHRENE